MINGKGVKYMCRVTGARHAPLHTVPHSVVTGLMHDQGFMAECKTDSIRDELRAKVASNAAKFA